jgi:hypothetical protein
VDANEEKHGAKIRLHLWRLYLEICKRRTESHLLSGRGREYLDVLSDMIARTNDLRNLDPEISVIWLIHFAPFPLCPTELELVDWQIVVAAAERLGVICTLCGHTHQQNRMSRDKHVPYCGGSAGSVDPVGESRVHIIEIDADSQGVGRLNFEYESQAQTFNFVSAD